MDYEALASDNGTNNDISIEHAGSVDSQRVRALFYSIIKAFLIVSLVLLCFKVVAYFKRWHFGAHKLQFQYIIATPFEIKGIFYWIHSKWVLVRAVYLAPTLQFLANLCILLFLVQSLDRLILCMGCFWIRLKKIKPVPKMNIDLESGDGKGYFPLVLVQIPMCNEREDNDEVGLVQGRWSFVNKDENLPTRLQNINSSFHFEVEQQVNGIFITFFGFNGTAGVWRIKALDECGGWLERTTVEGMDIAVRAHLKGWKFVFLNDVECQCELRESYEAYRKQQHRWHSGPMHLFRLCLPDITRSKISFWKKANLIFLFFLLRKLVLPFYSFTLFCIILPMTMFIPEAEIPAWVVCDIPAVMSMLNNMPAPKSFPYVVPYLLFENTMSITKFNAMIFSPFQLGSTYEWSLLRNLAVLPVEVRIAGRSVKTERIKMTGT